MQVTQYMLAAIGKVAAIAKGYRRKIRREGSARMPIANRDIVVIGNQACSNTSFITLLY